MSVVGKLALSVFPALIAVFGAGMVYKTYAGREEAATIRGAVERSIGDLTPGDGLVAVSGTVRAGADLLPAPMVDTEGVAVRTVVEERAADEIGSSRGTDWDTIYDAGDYVPFAIDDGTGEIAVEPPGGNVGEFLMDTASYESEPGEDPPEPVQRWLAATDGIEAAADQYRGYRQAVIEDGETVHGVGEPVSGESGLALTGDERPDDYVVSNLPRDEVADEASYGVGAYVLGTILFLLGSGAVTYLWLA